MRKSTISLCLARACALILWPLVLSLAAGEPMEADFGPLRLSERNPLYLRHLRPRMERSTPLTRGVWELDLSLAHSNIFEYRFSESHSQNIDFEMFSQALTLRRGFRERLELGMDVAFHSRSGGFLDPIVQNFHDLFGLPNDERDEVAENAYAFVFAPVGGEPYLAVDKAQMQMGALETFARYRLFGSEYSPSALTLQLLVKWPTGEHALSNRKLEAALAAAYSLRARDWRLHGNAAYSRLDQEAAFAAIGRRDVWSGGLALERRITHAYALIAQLETGGKILDGTGLDSLDEPPFNGGLGLMGRWRGGWSGRLAFMEDISARGPAVDFTVDLAFQRRF